MAGVRLPAWEFFFSSFDYDFVLNANTEERKQTPPVFEMELLEKALEKARDVRNCHEMVESTSKNDRKTRTTVQRSLQLAKTAYAPSSNPTKSQACKKKAGKSRSTSSSTNKKTISSAKSHTRTNVAQKRSGMDLKLVTSITGGSEEKGMSSGSGPSGPTPHTVHPPSVQLFEQSLLTNSHKAAQCDPTTSSDTSSGQFKIQTDG